VTLKEAINCIAFGNFAGPSLGPHPTSVFYQDLLTSVALRDDGKLELAFNQLWERAVAGAVRLAGLRVFPSPVETLLTDNAYEVIPPVVVRDGSWVAAGVVSRFAAYNARELVTGSVRYYEILVSWNDLWKWFWPTAEDRSSVRKRRAKNDAEKLCIEWIMQLAADGHKPRAATRSATKRSTSSQAF